MDIKYSDSFYTNKAINANNLNTTNMNISQSQIIDMRFQLSLILSCFK